MSADPREMDGPKPACFTTLQWDRWRAGERASEDPYPSAGYCTDCTLDHQTLMKAQGKCEQRAVFFVDFKGGDVEGVRPAGGMEIMRLTE